MFNVRGDAERTGDVEDAFAALHIDAKTIESPLAKQNLDNTRVRQPKYVPPPQRDGRWELVDLPGAPEMWHYIHVNEKVINYRRTAFY